MEGFACCCFLPFWSRSTMKNLKKNLAGYDVCESNCYCSGVPSTPSRMSPTIIKDANPAQAEVPFAQCERVSSEDNTFMFRGKQNNFP